MTSPENPREDAPAAPAAPAGGGSPSVLPPPPFAPPAPTTGEPGATTLTPPLPTLSGGGIPSAAVPVDAAGAPSTAGGIMSPVEVERHHLQQRVNGAAGWFFWIVGLSLIGSILHLSGSDLTFFLGLGITTVIDVFGRDSAGFAGKAIAFVVNLIPLGFYALMGFLGRRHRGALIAGAFFYFIDALIFLVVKDWISILVHGYVLYVLFRAIGAAGKIAKLPPPEGPGAFGVPSLQMPLPQSAEAGPAPPPAPPTNNR